MKDCLFCKFISGEIAPLKIYEDDDVMSFLSLENHPLIVPKKHIENVYDLDDRSATAVMKAAVKVSNAVRETYNCDGINLVQSNGKAAGQDVSHFHLHIKPRYINDSTVLNWDTGTVDEKTRVEIQEQLSVKL